MYEVTLAFSVLIFVVVCAIYSKSHAFSVFHPLSFYLLFHGTVFVFRPLLVWWYDYNTIYRVYQFNPSDGDRITALLVSIVGLIVFSGACLWAGNVPMAFRQDRLSNAERVRLQGPFLWVFSLLVPIGVYALANLFGTAVETGSAYSSIIRDGYKGTVYNQGMNGYLLEAPLLLGTCTAVTAWLFRFNIYSLFPIMAFCLFRAGTGLRGSIVTAIISLILFYFYDKRRSLPSIKILALAPVLLLVFTAIGDDRGATIRRLLTADNSSEIFGSKRNDERFMEGMDFANLEYLEYVIYVVPQRSGTYGYFNDILQIFTEPIPRAIWPSKPIGAPFQQINFFDYGNPLGMTISLPGEGWYSLGWLGVILWCGLAGAILGTIYRKFVYSSQSAFQVAAYVMFIPILVVAFRDGQVVTVFRQGLFFLTPIIVWWWFARRLGIPSLEFARQNVARGLGGPKTESRAPAADYALPPAVVRRRHTLANPREAEGAGAASTSNARSEGGGWIS